MHHKTIAALQIGSDPAGKAATLDRILGSEEAIRAAPCDLVMMPEALLGGYPKGEIFGTRLGYRLPEGRAAFARYFANAVDLDGPEVDALAQLATRTGATLVVGVIERGGASLYCTAVFLEPGAGLVAKHRKLTPTGTERLVWAQGDGATMLVVASGAGRIGAAICWENNMPLFRAAMYAQRPDIWCASIVDDRDVWQCTMRHIAHEGRCFVVSACQRQPSPERLGRTVEGWDPARPLINGGSVIVGPLGEVLAGPLFGEEGLIARRSTSRRWSAHAMTSMSSAIMRGPTCSRSRSTSGRAPACRSAGVSRLRVGATRSRCSPRRPRRAWCR
ncbi:carbon-nitrogen hydrolase family protein [Sphingomonas sp. PAMC 26605]|uniref:carbon-nitrogen hydrolase family protein n=1 Tax=Sphingomonas sp. PAMC 26605 TaxID=1112214 RepID=UPI00026CD21B|nr:carbon-nitrogen hydrolase family protein [Sphingomonas sp. PAMC 26605]